MKSRDYIGRKIRPSSRFNSLWINATNFSLREFTYQLTSILPFLPNRRIRMYQGRIQRWDLDKKLKAPEVAYALRLIDSRRGIGKETEIRIRGVGFSEERLRKYVERSRLVPDEDVSTPSAVTAHTPPPSGEASPSIVSSAATSASTTPRLPVAFPGEGTLPRHFDSDSPLTRKRPRFSPSGNRSWAPSAGSVSLPPVSRHPSPRLALFSASTSPSPDASKSPQAISSSHVMAHIDRYYKDYFDSRRWSPWAGAVLDFDEPQASSFSSPAPDEYLGIYFRPFWQSDPASVVHCVEIACQLFRSGNYALATRCLGQANSQIKTMLLERVPPLLACLLSAVCLLGSLKAEMHLSTDKPDPLMLFLESVSEMAETKLCSDHPITQVFSSLVKMRTDHHSVAQTALRRIVGTFRTRAGPLHPIHCRLEYNYAWVLIWRRQFAEAGAILERFPETVGLPTEFDDQHSRASRYLLAQVYIAVHRLSEAEQCFLEIIERAKKGLGEERAHLVTFEAWRMLAVIAGFQGRSDARNQWEQEALECGQMVFGPQHPRVVSMQRMMSRLEPRIAPEKQWRFIWSFPRIEDGMAAQ